MTWLWGCGFVFCCVAVLVLPFFPAMYEWGRPSDVGALPVLREHEGDIRAFAVRYLQLLDDEARALLDVAQRQLDNDRIVRLGDKAVRVLGDPATWASRLPPQSRIREGLLACASLCVPAGCVCDRELYTDDDLFLGAESVARAALSRGDMVLGKNSIVLRWADAGGTLSAADGVRLFGRAVSNGPMLLGSDMRFERLSSPWISIGEPRPHKENAHPELLSITSGGRALDEAGQFRRIEGDFEIEPAALLEEHLIVTGKLKVGAFARVAGSVKAYGQISLGRSSVVEGAVSCQGDLVLGRDAFAAGPIMCERKVFLDSGARVGSPESPTTLTAHRIVIAEGVSLHGLVWARSEGITVRSSLS